MYNSEERSSLNSAQDEYYDLGSYHRPISTKSTSAQIWFDRGLVWTYAFNHEEAARCFEQAIAHDRNCAMAYWGLAYTLGPNYNKPWEAFDDDDMTTSVARTHAAVVQATSTSQSATPIEQALARALAFRYPQSVRPNDELSIWNQQYAAAMESVYRRFPDDLDVAALYADALMNLTPWQLWDLTSGKPAAGARTLEAKEVLDQALATQEGSKHPGLLHLYIHLIEMSGAPEIALTAADRLRDLVPDSGHLNHMPTHLDILCGDYRQAIASNSRAVRADEKFVARAGPLNFYTLYRCHNYHFLIYAAMFSGQSKIAIDAVAQLEEAISEDILRVQSPPMADWLEGFLSTRVHVLVRFGRWEDLLHIDLPRDADLYCATTAMIHYGRGVAFAAIGQIGDAEVECKLFVDATKKVPPSRTLFNNACIDILRVAGAMLDGELAYRKKNYNDAFKNLLRSIELDDALPYDEPWGWMQPTRHAYGALLLEQGLVEEAAKVYSADLGMDDTLPRARRHLNNVWALHGFYECLLKLGRLAEARILEPQLKLAVAVADVQVKSSCFCRLETMEQ